MNSKTNQPNRRHNEQTLAIGRHCERSEAIHGAYQVAASEIASLRSQ